ncbi:hypothetical protein R4Y45_01405 [Holzapfeliella sp. He02]|uniref:Lipoprotein n=1 Tax=Holzapfeliella saturejae TaxID=3082953 RepID=A0ABU8SET1_9LACO
MKKAILLMGLLLLTLVMTGCTNDKSPAATTINLDNELANSKTGSFENGVLKTDSLTLKIVGYEIVKKNEYSDYLKDTAQYSMLIVKFDASSNIPNSEINANSAFYNFFNIYQDNEPLPVKLNFCGMTSPAKNIDSSNEFRYPSMFYSLKDDNSDFTLIATKGAQFLGKQHLKNPNNSET